jgi:exonuclease III
MGAHSNFEVLQFKHDTEGRVMSLLVGNGKQRINLISVYAPTGITERKQFIRDLNQYFYPGTPIVIGGDFNCIENDNDQFGHATAACRAGGEELKNLKATFDLVDIWRKRNKKG